MFTIFTCNWVSETYLTAFKNRFGETFDFKIQFNIIGLNNDSEAMSKRRHEYSTRFYHFSILLMYLTTYLSDAEKGS